MSDKEPAAFNPFDHPGHQLVIQGWIAELNRAEMGWVGTSEVSYEEDALVWDRSVSLLCTLLNAVRRINHLEKQLNEFRNRLIDDGK